MQLLEDKGSILLICVLLIVFLIGLLGVAIDVSRVAYEKENMQNAIDLAVLAGAQELTISPATAINVVKNYWELNGFNKADIQIITNYKADPNKLYAEASKNLNLIFMPLFGVTTKQIKVSAAAAAPNVGNYGPAFNYVVFSGNATDFKFGADNCTFNGKVYVNGNLAPSGKNNIFNDTVDLVKENNAKIPDNIFNGSVTTFADVIPIPPLNADEYKNKATIVYNTNKSFSGSINLNGIMYVNGDVTIGGGDCPISGNGIIFSTGKMSIGAHIRPASTADKFSFYSLKDISLSGGNKIINGLIYAPNGAVNASGENYTINGAIIAGKVNFTNKFYTLNYDSTIKSAKTNLIE